jgi:hypothetical protein
MKVCVIQFMFTLLGGSSSLTAPESGLTQTLTVRAEGPHTDDLVVELNRQGFDILQMDEERGEMTLLSKRPVTDGDLARCVARINLVRPMPSQVYLFIRSSRLSKQGMAVLGECVGLAGLVMTGSGIGDGWLDRIGPRSAIRFLDLTDCPITSEGLRCLGNFPKLETLVLDGTKIGDEALSYLRLVPNLSYLNASRTAISDKGILALSPDSRLRELHLDTTRVGDGAAPVLARLERLHDLHLADCRITNAGLAQLCNTDSIVILSVMHNDIDSDSLPYIVACRTLKRIDLDDTRVSIEACDCLRLLRPDLEVSCAQVNRRR